MALLPPEPRGGASQGGAGPVRASAAGPSRTAALSLVTAPRAIPQQHVEEVRSPSLRLYDAIEAGIAGSKAVTPEILTKFAKAARQRFQPEGGDYRRDHLRALA